MNRFSPEIDKRAFKELLEQAKALAPYYTPNWLPGQSCDPGFALLQIFLRMQEQIIERLNQVPEKNFITFLDMMGFRLSPAQSAEAPVTFALTKGATQQVRVPAGTLLSGTSDAGEQIFRTQSDVLVAPTGIKHIISYDVSADLLYDHVSNSESTPFTLFKGQGNQERSLYFGHPRLLNVENPVKIDLDFRLAQPTKENTNFALSWEYHSGERWVSIGRFGSNDEYHNTGENDGTELFSKSGLVTLIKAHKAEISETEVNGSKNRWLRCRLTNSNLAGTLVQLPTINTISLAVNPVESFLPELTFHNDVPLEVSEIKVPLLGIQGVKIDYIEISKLEIHFLQNAKREAQEIYLDKPVELFCIMGELEFYNFIDKPERRKIAETDLNGKKIILDKPLSYEYIAQPADQNEPRPLVRFFPPPGVVYIAAPSDKIEKNDVLRFDSIIDDPENRQVIQIESLPQSALDRSENDLAVYRIVLSEPLLHDYDQKTIITFITALRARDVQRAEQVDVFVESLAGLEVEDEIRVTIGSGDRRYAGIIKTINEPEKKIQNPDETYTPLTLSREAENAGVLARDFLAGSLLKISPKLRPFGEIPHIFDTFYIASGDAFSKRGATITLVVDCTLKENRADRKENSADSADKNILESEDLHPILSWQYWNGKSWRGLQVIDPTNNFSVKGDIEFICPDDIEKTQINGEEKYWIRVRLVGGNYGLPVIIDGETFAGVKTREGFVHYPIINEIKINYSDVFQPLEKCLTLNNLQYEDVTDASKNANLPPFQPFQVLPDRVRSTFLGFDRQISSGPIRILFDVSEQFSAPVDRPTVKWQYWNGRLWDELNVEDKTESLTQVGVLTLVFGNDFAKKRLFNKEAYWLKASLIKDSYQEPVTIRGIYPNTVYAEQAAVANDEIVGSSAGTVNQEFTLQHPLVIEQNVFVRELLSEDERESIRLAEGSDAVRVRKNELGEAIETLVRWCEVLDFDDAVSSDRCYTIDKRLGKITFGTGARGMIPPVGEGNIIVSYFYGGGKGGNVTKAAISGLKSAIPFVNTVTNYLRADSGAESESIDDVRIRGPLRLKNRDRAVTSEDFEALTKNASRKVARAKCLPCRDPLQEKSPGWVTVLIVPDDDGKKPQPSKLLIKDVKETLESLCTAVVASPQHIHVIGPQYVEITIEVTVIPTQLDFAARVEENVITTLDNYLHPLRGGLQKNGWEFGDTLCHSAFYSLIESLEYVDYVEKLIFRADSEIVLSDIKLDPYSLPCSGNHRIKLVQASSTTFDPCAFQQSECEHDNEF